MLTVCNFHYEYIRYDNDAWNHQVQRSVPVVFTHARRGLAVDVAGTLLLKEARCVCQLQAHARPLYLCASLGQHNEAKINQRIRDMSNCMSMS
jgi:hypothetical protein